MMSEQSLVAQQLSHDERSAVLRDVYKKHASELMALEESQQKLVLLLLGVFGGGASVLASAKLVFDTAGRLGLTLFVVATLIIAWEYTRRRDAARQGIRELLVRCEIALGFYDPNTYVHGTLYPMESQLFPKQGAWLSRTFGLAVLAGIGFLVVLWGSTRLP